ncbi:MAG: phosphatase PAP2 family protein [Actinomycetota bacterium]|nr:phosphatase PAP2 family protein [Actinomycetota bacterium]
MAVSIVYLLLVSGVMIWRGISVSPDYLLLILVPVALLSGRFLGFLRDWVPFIALFLGYEAVRGIAPKSGIRVHYYAVIRADKLLFGGTDPSRWVQAHLGSLHWLAVACTAVYFCHFVIPIAVGMVLWLVDRVQFLRFTVALLAMSFAAFIVFVLVPVAPPWLANQHHLLPGVHSLISLPSAVSPYYNWLNPDAAAAFPSLHSAYPLLAALALWPVTRRGSALGYAWCAAVWFSVVYLGQHYVTDVIAGIIFALGTWLIVTKILVPRVPSLQRQPAATVRAAPVPAATVRAAPVPAAPVPAATVPADAETGVSEPSSTGPDTAERGGPQERATPLGSG